MFAFFMLSAGDISHSVTDTLAMFQTECSFALVPMKRTSDFDGLSARPLFVNQSRTARLHLSRIRQWILGRRRYKVVCRPQIDEMRREVGDDTCHRGYEELVRTGSARGHSPEEPRCCNV